MPRLGFSVVPLDPFHTPKRDQLEALEKYCKADFFPLDTKITVFGTPQLILAPENEVCMTCPECGIIDKEYKWLDLLPLRYKFGEASSQNRRFFDCLMNCCNRPSNILDFDFSYPANIPEVGAGFASSEVSLFDVSNRCLNSQDLLDFAELLGCPVRAILITS